MDIEFYMGAGYRRDHLKYKNFNNTFPELVDNAFDIKEVNSAQEVLNLNLIWGMVRLDLEGDFGWLVTGRERVDFPYNQGNAPLSFPFKHIYGYEADGSGSLGYTFRLYSSQFLDFDVTPLFGFKYWHLATRVKGERFSNATSFYGFPAYARYQETVLQHGDFWGPYLEARVGFNFNQTVNLRLFYQYHFTYMRIKSEPTLDFYLEPGVPQLIAATMSWEAMIKDDSSRAQVGGFDINFKTLSNILVGGSFYGSVFYTREAKTYTQRLTVSLPANVIFPTAEAQYVNKSHVRWTIFSAVIYAGYVF